MNQQPGTVPKIDGRFFYYFCVVQGSAAYLLTALVGPTPPSAPVPLSAPASVVAQPPRFSSRRAPIRSATG